GAGLLNLAARADAGAARVKHLVVLGADVHVALRTGLRDDRAERERPAFGELFDLDEHVLVLAVDRGDRRAPVRLDRSAGARNPLRADRDPHRIVVEHGRLALPLELPVAGAADLRREARAPLGARTLSEAEIVTDAEPGAHRRVVLVLLALPEDLRL